MTIEIPWRSIFRVLTIVILVWLWIRLWQWILLLVIAIFLAVGLDPVVAWLEAHHVRRTYGAPLVILVLAGLLVAFGFLAGAELIEQARLLGGRISDIQSEVTGRLPPFLLKLLPDGSQSGGSWLADSGARLGQSMANGLLSLGLALILTIYFLLDGRRIFDFVPVIGVFLTLFPMVLLAMTVSMWTAVATVIFNAAYNALETYYISPKVYGNQLRLSSLAVILAFAVGAELGGVIGALVALPIAAMYPTIENLWLAGRLAPEVAADHRRIEHTKEH